MSRILRALAELEIVLSSKNEDYAPTGEFSNFEEAAKQVGKHMEVEDVMLAQIIIKLTRIRRLRESGAAPNNESLEDSYKDLAGYAVLLYAYRGKLPQPGHLDTTKLSVLDCPNEGRESHRWNGVLDA